MIQPRYHRRHQAVADSRLLPTSVNVLTGGTLALPRHCSNGVNISTMVATALETELQQQYKTLEVLESKAVTTLTLKLRDASTPPVVFKQYADRLMRILAEEGLASCASRTVSIVTPTGDAFSGIAPAEKVCAVSIIRAGDSLLQSIRTCDPSIAVGKILIQRDEESEDKHPVMYYSKLPPGISEFESVLLVDPMLGTGGSAKMAIKTLMAAGVEERKITFLNVISCPEGIHALFAAYPEVKVITTSIDPGMNSAKYITPGLGDYGDRYFNTVHPHQVTSP